MLAPWKPWPFGNKYHTICCGLWSILVGIELVEWNNDPKELGKPTYNNNCGATCGLLLRLKRPIWVSGRALVPDSCFCSMFNT